MYKIHNVFLLANIEETLLIALDKYGVTSVALLLLLLMLLLAMWLFIKIVDMSRKDKDADNESVKENRKMLAEQLLMNRRTTETLENTTKILSDQVAASSQRQDILQGIQVIIKGLVDKTDLHSGWLKTVEENTADFNNFARPVIARLDERGQNMYVILSEIPTRIAELEKNLGILIANLEMIHEMLKIERSKLTEETGPIIVEAIVKTEEKDTKNEL